MVVIGGLVGAGALGYDVVAGFSQGQLFGKGLAAGIAIVAARRHARPDHQAAAAGARTARMTTTHDSRTTDGARHVTQRRSRHARARQSGLG